MSSRRIVGWRVSSSLIADLALDALEMAIWTRGSKMLKGWSNTPTAEYLAIRYTEGLQETQAIQLARRTKMQSMSLDQIGPLDSDPNRHTARQSTRMT